jgi:hypothetical protein
MKRYSIFVLGFIFLCSGLVLAQTRTVTNADLEKYRQQRLQAEKDLRENYLQMGFPSPEEIRKQNEESRRELNEYADRLKELRLYRESLNREYIENQYTQTPTPNNGGFTDYGRRYAPYFYYGNYRNRRYYPTNRRVRRFRGRPSYRQRFINSLPGYVRRTHRFNQIEPNRTRRTNRGIRTNRN